MKIDINKVKPIPSHHAKPDKFGVCVYGDLSEDLGAWAYDNQLETERADKFVNIYLDGDLGDLFNERSMYAYLDGFSPNLNKHLHLGHLSNLVVGKALFSMSVAWDTVAILGDTLKGDVEKADALAKFNSLSHYFGYIPAQVFYASEMKLGDEFVDEDGIHPLLVPGEGEYAGTRVFDVGGKKVVGVKSDGTTSYFLQDVAFAKKLGNSTLYLTGHEQAEHFALLKQMFPHIDHLALGLVKAGSKKMSSREGNVIMAQDLIDIVHDQFDRNPAVTYNVIAGHILKSAPKSDKNIDMDSLGNPLNSQGLYLSYTLAKLKSAGVVVTKKWYSQDVSPALQFAWRKAYDTLSPNVLFAATVSHAERISALYQTHKIAGNEENLEMFGDLAADLWWGMEKLGLMEVERV